MKPIVLELKNVTYKTNGEKADLSEVSFALRRGHRAKLLFAHPEQAETLWRLLQTNLGPHIGSVSRPAQDQCYSNRRLVDGLSLQASVFENLESPRFAKRPWVNGRPRTWHQIAGLLEIPNSIMREPLANVESHFQQRIIWIFLWCLEVEFLILEKVLENLHQTLIELIFGWWAEFPGAILCLGKSYKKFSFQDHFELNSAGYLIQGHHQT
jgi:ATPase subunit of ABC transporter with duplicated ATPase domains